MSPTEKKAIRNVVIFMVAKIALLVAINRLAERALSKKQDELLSKMDPFLVDTTK